MQAASSVKYLSSVSIFKVDPIFDRNPVWLLKKGIGIGLVGIKHGTRQDVFSFLKLGNVFLHSAVEDKVRVIET